MSYAPASGSQTPVWEQRFGNLRFLLRLSEMEFRKKGVPKPEFGNEELLGIFLRDGASRWYRRLLCDIPEIMPSPGSDCPGLIALSPIKMDAVKAAIVEALDLK